MRDLVIVLGDQLDLQSSAFDDFDAGQDAAWMAEVPEESSHVASGRPRIALFLSAMRHFAQALREADRPLHYTRLGEGEPEGTLAAQLLADIRRLQPRRLVMSAPGDWRVLQSLKGVAEAANLPLEIREDRHFFTTVREFAAHARGRRTLRMENFYREQRLKHGILVEDGRPVGGQWNFDALNREGFGREGPVDPPPPPRLRFTPDAITRDVLAEVDRRFPSRAGSLDDFAWPVTRAQALEALRRFVDERLPLFGRWQDAMWPGQPWLWHAQVSAAMNLKLLGAREVVAAAVSAWQSGAAPLASVEGFVRQVLGWREYVRGVYWLGMPACASANVLEAHEPLPDWYWTGETEFACLRDTVTQTLDTGYAHHIQRLMVTGLYALMLGVEPRQVHEWFLATHVDAVEWVELPNTMFMSQHADGGRMASKPYIASGRYIERMSGGAWCRDCRFDPGRRAGDDACPFTTLYWDFLARHEARYARHPRLGAQVRNLLRLDAGEREGIAARAEALRRGDIGALP